MRLRRRARERPPVLLIDELDRADEEFESFLLEVLSDWQISIPEIGTSRATSIPHVVVITSNRTRELSDAIRRRCLYLWIDYPDFDKELAILRIKVDGIVEETLGVVFKDWADTRHMKASLAEFLEQLGIRSKIAPLPPSSQESGPA